MLRTQIQLTKEQVGRLRQIASREKTSVAEIIRRAVDRLTGKQPHPSDDEVRRRAIAASGRFSSGQHDISRDHDRHLADIFGS
jgi:hypothetical protein